MGVKTTVAAISYATNHIQAAAATAQDVKTLHNMILVQATELIRNLNILKATMQGGDANIATINAQIAALS